MNFHKLILQSKLVILLFIIILTFVSQKMDAQQPIFFESSIQLSQGNSKSINIPNQIKQNLVSQPFISFALKIDDFHDFDIIFNLDIELANEINYAELIYNNHHLQASEYTSNLIFLPTNITHLTLIHQSSFPINKKIKIHWYLPSKSKNSITSHSTLPYAKEDDCNCPSPVFQSREDWNLSNCCPIHNTPTNTTPTHVVIHHSATSNTSTDWAATVRSVYNYHVNTNGWDDIGYNWLIDPNGILYQGRSEGIQGAHFCSTNQNTHGVCMLGTYTADSPSTQSIQTLEEYLAWTTSQYDINPIGNSIHSSSGNALNHILGHQDGCSTTCPGNSLYGIISQIITETYQIQTQQCSAVSAPTQIQSNITSDNNVQITWQDNATDEDNYIVARGNTLNDSFVSLGTLAPNTTNYTDLTTENNTDYYYEIIATRNGNQSTCQLITHIKTPMVSMIDKLHTTPFYVYPSPSSDNINIHKIQPNQQFTEISILDLQGRMVLQLDLINISQNQQINISQLNAGLYFIVIKSDNKNYIRKILKL